MSHRVKVWHKKIKVREVLDKNLKMFECEAKTLNKRRSFHFSPHQIKFSSSWICSRLLFLLLLFFNKKRLNERFVYQLSQPIPSPPLPRSFCSPSLDVLRLSVMDGEQKRTSAALPVSRSVFAYMIVTATVCFQRLGRPLGFSSSPCSSSSGLSVRRFGLLRVRPVKLLHSHGPPVSRPASR